MDYILEMDHLAYIRDQQEAQEVKRNAKPVLHGLTFRRRLVLSRWGIESTKHGWAINMGRTVIYVR